MNQSSLKPGQVKAETARLARRIRSFDKHRAALEVAIEDLPGGLDKAEWRNSFEDVDPRRTNAVLAITAGFSTLTNNYGELVRTSARLTGLASGKRPNVDQCLERIHDEGAITSDQAATAKRYFAIEGRMEHLSPDLSAEEIRLAIVGLREGLPGLLTSTVKWLRAKGIPVPEASDA